MTKTEHKIRGEVWLVPVEEAWKYMHNDCDYCHRQLQAAKRYKVDRVIVTKEHGTGDIMGVEF